jgi:hypothetical protein
MTQDALYSLGFDFRLVHQPVGKRVTQVVKSKPHRLVFTMSTGARDKSKVLQVRDEGGSERVYYGVYFTKSEHSDDHPIPGVHVQGCQERLRAGRPGNDQLSTPLHEFEPGTVGRGRFEKISYPLGKDDGAHGERA